MGRAWFRFKPVSTWVNGTVTAASLIVHEGTGRMSASSVTVNYNNSLLAEDTVTYSNSSSYHPDSSLSVGASGYDYAFNITGALYYWEAFTADAGVILTNSNTTDRNYRKTFLSTEYSDAAKRPRLSVTYTASSAHLTLSPTSISFVEGGYADVTVSFNSGATVSIYAASFDLTASVVSSTSTSKVYRIGCTGTAGSRSMTFESSDGLTAVLGISVTAAGSITNGTYYINNINSAKLLHVANGGTTDGTNVYQYAYTGATRQQWKITNLGSGYYSIRPAHASSSMGLAVYSPYSSSNASVVIRDIGTADSSSSVPTYGQWSFVDAGSGYYYIKNRATGYVIGISGSSLVNMGDAMQTTQSSTNTKKFKLTLTSSYSPVESININNNLYLGINQTHTMYVNVLPVYATFGSKMQWTSSNTSVATVNSITGKITALSAGTTTITVRALESNATSTCILEVLPISNGYYFLKNKKTGRFMDVEDNSLSSGAQVHQWDFYGISSQMWYFSLDTSTGYYSIKNKNSNLYLGVENNSTSNNATVKQYSYSSSASGQKWKIATTSSGAYKITPKSGEANNRVLAVGGYVLNINGIDIEQRNYTNDTDYNDEWLLLSKKYTATVNNYYDHGYHVHYNETEDESKDKINAYNHAIYLRYLELLELDLSFNYPGYFRSAIDICKGTVTSSNVNTLCTHSGTAHTDRSSVIDNFRSNYSGNNVTTNVLWTAHKIKSVASNGDINYNRSCSVGDSIYIHSTDKLFRTSVSEGVLMHELNHQYGAPDHYHEENADGICKFKSICSECGDNKRPSSCIMNDSSRNISNDNIICNGCTNDILTHLNLHH